MTIYKRMESLTCVIFSTNLKCLYSFKNAEDAQSHNLLKLDFQDTKIEENNLEISVLSFY